MFALLRTRRYPEGGVGSSRHIPGERPACWVPWLAQRPWRPLVRPKGPRAPCFIRKGGINNNNNNTRLGSRGFAWFVSELEFRSAGGWGLIGRSNYGPRPPPHLRSDPSRAAARTPTHLSTCGSVKR